MLSKKESQGKGRLIDYILITGFVWMAFNVLIAMYVKIEAEQMRSLMGLSILLSMVVILLASLGKFLLFITNKLQSTLQSQLSKQDYRNSGRR